MDVIDATAEALPLELLNATNKELTAQLSHCEQQVEEKARAIEDQRKRLAFMQEHLSNVRAEIVNTQSLAESKEREVQSEDNMCKIITKECSRLQQRQKQLKRSEEEVQDQITALQNRIFQGNLRMEEFKAAMNFNQEELEQWDEARRQKEEDELAIAQYSKQDEAKLRHLTLKVERLEGEVRANRAQLDSELLATQNAQAELDHVAADYRHVHDERGGLLDEWERVVQTIAERDDAIRVAAEQYEEGTEWLLRRDDVRRSLSDALDEAKKETEVINNTISEREKKAQGLRDALPPLARHVEDLENEVAAMREELTRARKDKSENASRLQDTLAEITRRANELEMIQKRREEAKENLQNEIAAAEDLHQQSSLITKLYEDARKADQTMEKDIESLKKTLFRVNQELHKARDEQNSKLSEISGSQAQGKSLLARIAQLDSDAFTQQGILYNIEFNVQQMEKKVNRAKGERTEDERRELHEKINLLQFTLDELEQQHRILDAQAKRVREDGRQSRVAIEKLEAERRREEDRAMDLALQCTHGEREIKQQDHFLEDHLVKVDTLELQLIRLRKQLQRRSDELASVEDRKRQLAADIGEREAEIAVHHNLLKMESKLMEEERKHLAGELLSRQRNLVAIRNRHEILIGRMDPAQARLSQAQLVVEAAKEREGLQYRGDSLDARIKRMERELLKLEKTIAIIKASNSSYRHKFDAVSNGHEEVKTQRALQQRYRELKTLMSRRALDSNNYQAALESKRNELEQVLLERERLERTLADTQQECDLTAEQVLKDREAVVRYEQAISKARGAVEEAVAKDVELLEAKERLGTVVGHLLQCSMDAGEEVYDAVKRMVVDSDLPFPK